MRYTQIPVHLNLDMVGRDEDIPDSINPRFMGLRKTRAIDNTNTLHLLGYSYSPDLAGTVRDANREIGLDIRTNYDTLAQLLLRRSDQWSFLQRRTPAVFLTTGPHPDYHTPQDDVQKIDFDKLEKIARLASPHRVECRQSAGPTGLHACRARRHGTALRMTRRRRTGATT